MFIQLHVSQLSECITSRRFSLGGYACLRFVSNCIAVVIAPPPEYCDDRVCESVCLSVHEYEYISLGTTRATFVIFVHVTYDCC